METTQELTVIDKSIDVFKGGSAILLNHQTRAAKALKVAGDILQQWENAYREPDESVRKGMLAAIDKRSNDFLANCGVAKKDMEDSRKAITQLMDVIRDMFTQEEKKLDVKNKDSKPIAIQVRRNQYAKEMADQQERDRKLAEQKALQTQEENDIRAYIRTQITQKLLQYLADRKSKITDSFNKITLVDFEEKSTSLAKMSVDFLQRELGTVISYPEPTYSRIDFTRYNMIKIAEHGDYDFQTFYKNYAQVIGELKQSLIDRLPAKKEELLEQKRVADEAESRRLDELKKQQQAEADRQEKIRTAKAGEKKRLEEEAELARKKEADRLKDIERQAEDDRIRAEADQKLREEEDRLRLAREAQDAEKKANEEIQLQKAADDAASMFDQTSETAQLNDAPEAKSGYEIKVNHPAGIVELFQFWFTRESAKLSIDEMLKKSVAQMKAYAEKAALKDDTKISSKYLTYEKLIKSVNRKEKV